MELPRRTFLRLSASAAALPFTTYLVGAQSLHPPPASAARELPLANRLADYTHGVRYEDFDEATIERVKTHVIDTIGCAIGALNERPVRICREIAVGAAGSSTIVGTNQRTTPDLAAFANSAAARYLDFNDTYGRLGLVKTVSSRASNRAVRGAFLG